MINRNPKIFIITVFVSCFLISNFQVTSAQTSIQFLTSWQAQSYAPFWYQGKIFPTRGTPVEISFELLNKGKATDLSQTKIRWYVNEQLSANEDNGLGLKTLKIVIPDYAGHETNVRIAIVNYLGGDTLYKNIAIPVVAPETVIEAPYADRKIGFGQSVFKAAPFFFNVKNLDNLSIDWSTGEQEVENQSTNSWLLNLNIEPTTPSGAAISLSAEIKNILNELEFAVKSIQLQTK
jgi:hypothetical protein